MAPLSQDEFDEVSFYFAVKGGKKFYLFPEKHRMNTHVDLQAVSHEPPLCLPIRPWEKVTAGLCHATE